jgi:hypothetical protein
MEGPHIVSGHLLKDKYQLCVPCMLYICIFIIIND